MEQRDADSGVQPDGVDVEAGHEPDAAGPVDRWRYVFVALLALGVAMVATTLYLALDGNLRHTGARRVAWRVSGKSAVIEPREESTQNPWSNCGMLDVGLHLLVDGGSVWTSCARSAALPNGALARIDPARGQGTFFPFPAGLRFGQLTVGVVPRADGALGIVYHVGEVGGPLAAGVITKAGWAVPPRQLDQADNGRFLGGAWVHGALEVVIRPGGPCMECKGPGEGGIDLKNGTFRSPIILRLTAKGISKREPWLRSKVCSQFSFCASFPMVLRQAGQWVAIIVAEKKGAKHSYLWMLPENGQASPLQWPVDAMVDQFVDRVALGVTQPPILGYEQKKTYVLGKDGKLRPEKSRARAGWRHEHSDLSFIVRKGSLQRLDHWSRMKRAALAREVGGRFIYIEDADERKDSLLTLVDATHENHVQRHDVARTPSWCSELFMGVFVPKSNGYALVSGSGCYIQLDDHFRRTDPLGLVEHLRRRGSLGMDWNERSHEWMLLWVLLGWLPCLAFGLLRVRRSSAGEGRRWQWPKTMSLVLVAYLLTAGFCLLELLPLLVS